jgi:hypothetical protein
MPIVSRVVAAPLVRKVTQATQGCVGGQGTYVMTRRGPVATQCFGSPIPVRVNYGCEKP